MTEKSRLCRIGAKGVSSAFSKVGLTLFLFLMILYWSVPAQAQTWYPTGNMGTDRRHATATTLLDGRVLVVGGMITKSPAEFQTPPAQPGDGTYFLASAEIYDPVTDQFTVTGSLATARALHTATLLEDGRVLVAGGWNAGINPSTLASAEIYDPSTGTFSPTGNLNKVRGQHAATLLNTGKVLMSGGYSSSPIIHQTVELYDPTTGTFSYPTGPYPLMAIHRNNHTATLLPDGKVLIAGGYTPNTPTNSTDIYDPVTDSFIAAGGPPMPSPRANHTATLLPNGKVLLAGGWSGSAVLNTVLLYDPLVPVPAFSSATNLNSARQWHSATLLLNGKVLVAGGNNSSTGGFFWAYDDRAQYLNNAELYDPTSDTFSYTPSMNSGRSMISAALLTTGNVLIPGGGYNSAERYNATLAAWYPFNGNALDASGNGYNGTVAGGIISVPDRYGNLNSAYYFDGVDGKITMLQDEFTPDNNITFSAWIKIDGAQDGLQSAVNFFVTCSNFGVGQRVGTDEVAFAISLPLTEDARVSFQRGQWFHFAGAYDGQTIRTYINGLLANETYHPGNISDPNRPLSFGINFAGEFWEGYIDDARIYNIVLSPTAIQQLAQQFLFSPCAGQGGDTDGDGVCDGGTNPDNCPDDVNPLQEDQDRDGLGDPCDSNAMGEDPEDKPVIAAVVAPSPDGSISLSVTVKLKALNWDGSNGIDDTLYVKPNPENVVVRLEDTGGNEIVANQVLCGPPCSLPDDLVKVTAEEGSRDFSTVIPLSEWFTDLPPADYLVEVSFTNLCDDPDKNSDGNCPLDDQTSPPSPEDSDCFLGVWQGTETIKEDLSLSVGSQNAVDQCPDDNIDPGQGAGSTGCEYADYNYVVLHTVRLGKGPSMKETLEGVEVRVFDRNDPDFQAQFGKNPKGSEYGLVFEPQLVGYVGACITDANGECYVGEEQTGDYLVIAKYFDSQTGNTVYVGRPKGPEDFVNNIAVKEFQFIKVIKKNGDIVWRGGSKMVVNGSFLEVIAPESAIWEGTQSVYPFIFTSDSNWTVDVCAEVPSGYNIVGVYDENGDLIPSADCIQAFVTGEAKTVAFEVQEVGSPEPYLDATLDIAGPKGKKVKKKVKALDIRKKTFKEKLKEKKIKKKK